MKLCLNLAQDNDIIKALAAQAEKKNPVVRRGIAMS